VDEDNLQKIRCRSVPQQLMSLAVVTFQLFYFPVCKTKPSQTFSRKSLKVLFHVHQVGFHPFARCNLIYSAVQNHETSKISNFSHANDIFYFMK